MSAVIEHSVTSSLSIRQEKFVLEYVKHGNASRAARVAGYHEKSGATIANLESVKRAVSALREQYRSGAHLTNERIMREVADVALIDPADLVDPDTGKLRPLHDMPEGARRAISSIETEELFEGQGKEREHIGTLVKVKLWNKPQTLELAAKIRGMVRESSQVNVGHLTIVLKDCD